ncbi:MAG: PadR family transcriptional regulator [Candidatus Eremiobacteraeota bacterium]|nr:PadR family transcriptional regulator [Candidatus Eremiobacteraeota bacterium]
MERSAERPVRQAAPADDDLNATAASLLGFLQEAPRSGYDLEVVIDGSIGRFWNVTRSQIYRELRALEDAGLVSSAEPGVRARRVYALTARGRKAFGVWLTREPGRDLTRIPFLLQVFFADALPPDVLAARVRERRALHEAQRDEYCRRLPEVEAEAPFPALTMRFGLRYAEVSLAWLDDIDAFTAKRKRKRR